MIRTTVALALAASACASAPPPPPVIVPIPAAALSFEQKAAAILRLENQRVLRDQAPPADQPAPVAAVLVQKAPVVAPSPPPPDLIRLLCDSHNQHAAEQLYGRAFMDKVRLSRKSTRAGASFQATMF